MGGDECSYKSSIPHTGLVLLQTSKYLLTTHQFNVLVTRSCRTTISRLTVKSMLDLYLFKNCLLRLIYWSPPFVHFIYTLLPVHHSHPSTPFVRGPEGGCLRWTSDPGHTISLDKSFFRSSYLRKNKRRTTKNIKPLIKWNNFLWLIRVL